MKLEYIGEGDEFCPLIRLYQFGKSQIDILMAGMKTLIDGYKTSIAVHELPFVETIFDIQLFFEIGRKDKGVLGDGTGKAFRCSLSKEGWSEVFELIESFADDLSSGGHQWLNRDGDISLLLSPTGEW